MGQDNGFINDAITTNKKYQAEKIFTVTEGCNEMKKQQKGKGGGVHKHTPYPIPISVFFFYKYFLWALDESKKNTSDPF